VKLVEREDVDTSDISFNGFGQAIPNLLSGVLSESLMVCPFLRTAQNQRPCPHYHPRHHGFCKFHVERWIIYPSSVAMGIDKPRLAQKYQ
jgi:hypothetical protein